MRRSMVEVCAERWNRRRLVLPSLGSPAWFPLPWHFFWLGSVGPSVAVTFSFKQILGSTAPPRTIKQDPGWEPEYRDFLRNINSSAPTAPKRWSKKGHIICYKSKSFFVEVCAAAARSECDHVSSLATIPQT